MNTFLFFLGHELIPYWHVASGTRVQIPGTQWIDFNFFSGALVDPRRFSHENWNNLFRLWFHLVIHLPLKSPTKWYILEHDSKLPGVQIAGLPFQTPEYIVPGNLESMYFIMKNGTRISQKRWSVTWDLNFLPDYEEEKFLCSSSL